MPLKHILATCLALLVCSCASHRETARIPQPRGGKPVSHPQPPPIRTSNIPVQPVPRTESPARPTTGLDAAPKKPGPGLVYMGRFGGDEGERALIKDEAQGLAVFKAPGQEAFGYKLLEVETDYVLLERNGEVLQLPLNGKP